MTAQESLSRALDQRDPTAAVVEEFEAARLNFDRTTSQQEALCTALRQQVSELQLEVQTVKTDVHAARHLASETAKSGNDTKAENHVLRERLTRADSRIQTVERDLDAARAKSEAAELERDALATVVRDLHGARQDAEEEVSALRQQVSSRVIPR